MISCIKAEKISRSIFSEEIDKYLNTYKDEKEEAKENNEIKITKKELEGIYKLGDIMK